MPNLLGEQLYQFLYTILNLILAILCPLKKIICFEIENTYLKLERI